MAQKARRVAESRSSELTRDLGLSINIARVRPGGAVAILDGKFADSVEPAHVLGSAGRCCRALHEATYPRLAHPFSIAWTATGQGRSTGKGLERAMTDVGPGGAHPNAHGDRTPLHVVARVDRTGLLQRLAHR